MRHRKRSARLSRTASHKRCMIANMLKALVEQGRIETSVVKAKELRRYADKLVTIAKSDNLANRRRAIAKLMVRYNTLSSKDARAAREGNTHAFNTDRKVIGKLFGDLGPRFATRNGGYTRIIKLGKRAGDNNQRCIIEYLSE